MKKIYFAFYLFVALFALSCRAVNEVELAPPTTSVEVVDDPTLIARGLVQLELSDAEKVAQRFMLNDTKKLFSVSAATRADQMTSVRDSVGNPLMYVVNFEQGGFCIVSATKKAYPILAHSDEGFFDLSRVDQSGVCLWLDEMVYGITHRDTLSEDERIFVNSAWAEYEQGFNPSQTRASGAENAQRAEAFNNRMSYYMSNSSHGDPIPLNGAIANSSIPDYVISGAQYAARNSGCPEEYVIIVKIDMNEYRSVDQLLTTVWDQFPPYNEACPVMNGNHVPAGCVAIAMAQIMNYHKWPSRFDWANIADSYGNPKPGVADFIYQIGLAVDMEYGPDGSGSNIDKAQSAFKRDFGYDAVLYKEDFPQEEILTHKRPYYARGMTEVEAGEGHAWVCDGARELLERKLYKVDCPHYRNGEYVYEIASEYPYSGYTSISTHINWGWGPWYNGWYIGNPSQANSNNKNFQYFKKYLSIRPIYKPQPPTGGGGTIIRPPGGSTIIRTNPGDVIIEPMKLIH